MALHTGERPELIAACDWSVGEEKRWMAVAVRECGQYYMFPPEPVGPVASLLADLTERAAGGPIFVGFDFPIGLPRAYAERAGIQSFTEALRDFGRGDWADFYQVATTPDEIDLRRPFYPPSSTFRGERSKAHLSKLTCGDMKALLRRCDQATKSRPAASELFWTLGAKQVGRGAISGWRDVLAPSLPGIAIWPFAHRSLDALWESGELVVAEIYPAEAYRLANVRFAHGEGKTSREGRRANAGQIARWCDDHPVRPAGKLVAMIEDGFGTGSFAEDMFDSVMGLFSMIEVVNGAAVGVPENDEAVYTVEGWIVGLQDADLL
jgi:hypothetical protein